MKVKWLNILLLSLFFCVFFLVSYLHTPRGHYYTDYSLTEVLTLSKKDDDIVIYFARDDCSECQLLDEQLRESDSYLHNNVYRIETKKEIDREELSNFLSENNINKVPTLWLKRNKTSLEREALF